MAYKAAERLDLKFNRLKVVATIQPVCLNNLGMLIWKLITAVTSQADR
jgi:hypothetical protein